MKHNHVSLYEEILSNKKDRSFIQEHGILRTHLCGPTDSVRTKGRLPMAASLKIPKIWSWSCFNLFTVFCARQTHWTYYATKPSKTSRQTIVSTNSRFYVAYSATTCSSTRILLVVRLTVQIEDTMDCRCKKHKDKIVSQDWVIGGVCV